MKKDKDGIRVGTCKKDRNKGLLRHNEMMDWPCPLCGGKVEMQACATICLDCDVSLDPQTKEPFTDSAGRIVRAASFGGGQIP